MASSPGSVHEMATLELGMGSLDTKRKADPRRVVPADALFSILIAEDSDEHRMHDNLRDHSSTLDKTNLLHGRPNVREMCESIKF